MKSLCLCSQNFAVAIYESFLYEQISKDLNMVELKNEFWAVSGFEKQGSEPTKGFPRSQTG